MPTCKAVRSLPRLPFWLVLLHCLTGGEPDDAWFTRKFGQIHCAANSAQPIRTTNAVANTG